MLHGIIFVVHLSIGGDKLVFRYPHVTREKVSQETLVAFKQSTTKADHADADDPPPPSVSSVPPSSGPSQDRRDRSATAIDPPADSKDRNKDRWYNTPSVVLAPILTPKAQLCDLPFDLTIDDTRFIGHPSLVQKKVAENIEFGTIDIIDENNTDNKNNSITNSTNNKNNGNNNIINDNKNNPANDMNGVGDDKAEQGKDGNEGERQGQGEQKKSDHKDELRLFNIVFSVPASTSSQRANRFKWMAAQIAAALLHEQSRCGYLIEQVNLMSSIRDEWLLEQTRKIAEANQANASSRKDTANVNQQSFFPRDDPTNHRTTYGGHYDLTLRLLKASRLACEIRDIFTSISAGTPGMGIRFNNWVTVPLLLQDPNAHSLLPLRPYHTLLLLDPHPHDTTADRLPALKRLMEAAKPTKTFRELQTETDIPLAQMYRMAAHLVFWGRAKIINIMTKNNTYILAPTSNVINDNLPALWREFSKTFPYFNLIEILASFSIPKPLGDHVKSLQSGYTHYRDFVLVVTWLLQKDLIVQLHTYVHLMLPREPDGNSGAASRLSYSTAPVHSAYKYTPPYPSCPQPLQSDELAQLEKLDDGTSTYQLLRRLAPYFRGQHTIEEIMWRENVAREQLLKLFHKHKNILIRVVHEGSNANKEIMGIY